MKFRTFRLLAVGGVLLAGGGLVYWLKSRPATEAPVVEAPARPIPPTNAAPTNAAPTNAAPTNAAPTNAAPTNAAPTNAAPGALRAMDEEILKRLGAPIIGEKAKDVFAGRAHKVNLFQEGGARLPNRVKIDLDRDDKWDEKWSIERDGSAMKVKRKVAPADDEKYTDEYRLDAGRWRRK